MVNKGLEDVIIYMSDTEIRETHCNICGSEDYEILIPGSLQGDLEAHYFKITDSHYGYTGQIVRCNKCGLVYTSPRVSGKTLENYYNQLMDPEYEREAEGRMTAFRRILQQVDKLSVDRGRLLDVGASTGLFMNLARNMGWEVYGIEPSEWAVQYALDNYQLSIHHGVYSKDIFRDRQFDLVTLLDVIEHVDDPLGLCKNIYDVVSPNGILCIVTPNIDSIAFRLLKRRWWHVRVAHIHFFSPGTLSRLLDMAGFKIIKHRHYSWYFSIRYLLSRFDNTFIKCLHNNFNRLYICRKFLNTKIRVNFFDSMEIYARKIPR